MNMNLKRILSSALVVIMLFSAVAVLLPVKAQAAHHSSVDTNRLSDDDVSKEVDKYINSKNAFTSLEEMFRYDFDNGYLDHATNGTFSIYVNRYTGVFYYVNNYTGEMLSSNSYNFSGVGGDYLTELTSQILVKYATVSNTEIDKVLYSSTSSAKLNQISVTKIDNGLRVNYAIGNTETRCLLPVIIEAHDFEQDILRPILDTLYEEMLTKLGPQYAINYFNENGRYYKEETVYAERFMHQSSIRKFSEDYKNKISEYESDVRQSNSGKIPTEKAVLISQVNAVFTALETVFNAYTPHNPKHKSFDPDKLGVPDITKTEEKIAVYQVKVPEYSQMATKAKFVKKYCPNYTFEMMYEDEKECLYVHPYEPKPVFRCALEYTINEDGTLNVRLPSNSIVFDETEYILKEITPLKFFGAADFSEDGYIFIPDGSGSIIEFKDFRGGSITLSSNLNFYGNDFCYSEISGAHKQPLTMPVYGIVNSKDVGGNNVRTGYFAILEEGSSMASMNIVYNGSGEATFQEGSVYTTFTPYPTDKFDISDTISVGSSKYYSIVSESKYTGSYVTKYVMLSNTLTPGVDNYDATYMGMAEYYRNYLEKTGVLKTLENTPDELPLYLEALGSLKVVEKILTFPVKVSKPITTFEDIVTIYDDLGKAKEKLLQKAREYEELAAAEEDNISLKNSYLDTAAKYNKMANEVVESIDNINFKLTGFTNGGLYFTYPTKVKWERTLGGKRGFKQLLKDAKERTDADSNFGVYPDFDFQYVNNTSLFDGIGKRNTLSRMVDNRYASKQVYSMGKFDTIYAMIVSADALDRLYNKFERKYGKYDALGISLSTLGSDLNSNFDKDNPVSRDDAQGYVTALLDRIANESNYSIMTSLGNIYAVKYADHILGICTDSSYYRYSSYTIPFVGMILHGYVNYTGSALNYSGSPDYDLLRSLESGASLYYIIGYQNTDLMKDDEEFNKFYSVSYENWFDDIVEKYSILNAQLGDIQDYKIVNHEILIGERIIDEDEQIANLEALKKEFVNKFDSELQKAIDAKLDSLRENGASAEVRVTVDADIDALVSIAHGLFELSNNETLPESFRAALADVLSRYQKEYDITGVAPENIETVVFDTAVFEASYESSYKYVTGSTARDGAAYERTDYTVDNDTIIIVTYKHDVTGDTRSFILNYNIYSVEVTLEPGAEPIRIEKYGFVRIDG